MSNRGYYVALKINTDQERNKLFQYFLTFTLLRPTYHVWTHCEICSNFISRCNVNVGIFFLQDCNFR